MHDTTAALEFRSHFEHYISSLHRLCLRAGLIVNSRPLDYSFLSSEELASFKPEISSTYIDTLSEFEEKGGNLLDSRQALNFALKKMEFNVAKSVIEKIDPNDVIEVYDPSGRQIFRSLNFLAFSSYSLEELSAYPWMSLFKRDQVHIGKIWAAGETILAGASRFIEEFCDPHHVSETGGKQRDVWVRYKFMAKATDENGNALVIVCCQFKNT